MHRAELEAVARAWVQLCASTRAGAFAGLEAFFQALPEAVTTVEQLLVDEAAQAVAVRWRAQSGTRVVTGIELVTLREGRVSERWGEWDDAALRSSGQGS
jgi:hypothetical protein